jgi:hypothetical protein
VVPAVNAQTKQPGSPPAASTAEMAKFKAADKDGNGALEGAEINPFKASMTKIDTDNDGKITREEYAAASRSGVIR